LSRDEAIQQKVEALLEGTLPIVVQQQTRALDCRLAFAETCKALLRGGPVVVREAEARPGLTWSPTAYTLVKSSGGEIMDIEEFQARWRLEQLTRKDVEDFAARLLEEGLDGPCLRELAWSHDSWQEVGNLIVCALGELGYLVMTEEDARYWWARKVASSIVDGSVVPYQGARMIYWECWAGVIPRPEDIMRFYWLMFEAVESDTEENPTPELKAKIKSEAEAFLTRRREVSR
jgi:hypothetical protein